MSRSAGLNKVLSHVFDKDNLVVDWGAGLIKNIKDFLSFPSPTKLQQIGRKLTVSLRHELGSDINDIEKTVQTLVKISCIVTLDDDQTKQTVCECADEILKQLFQSGDYAASLVANAFLVYMGILKGEDKKYRPPSDITGPLIVLEHAVRQSYFSRHARKLISAFMDKPHPLLTKSAGIRNTLLQTLYTI